MIAPPFEFVERFRANLLRARRRTGLSQEQLSDLAALHRTAIGLMESGERIPRIDTLIRLAASLEVTPGDLLDGLDWVPVRDGAKGSYWTRPVGTARSRTDG